MTAAGALALALAAAGRPPPEAVPVAIFGMFGALWALIAAVSCAGLVFWIVCIVDVVQRDFPGPNEKLMWVLIIVLTGWIGGLVYWIVGRGNGTRRQGPAPGR